MRLKEGVTTQGVHPVTWQYLFHADELTRRSLKMPLTLRQKQSLFTKKICELTLWAYKRGYEVTDGHALRCKDCPIGIEKSKHKVKLARDLNLFKDGKYLRSTEDHRFLGEKWEKMGGVWGGRFAKKDGCHYQYGPGLEV